MARSPRKRALWRTAGETPCAEKTTWLPRRHLADVVDEHGSAPLEVADDVRVVDDLLADVDRRPVQLEGPLHGLDCPLDAGAIAPWRGEDQPLDHRLSV